MRHGEISPGGSMEAFLALEEALCTCDEHPESLDPECLFCWPSVEDDE